jgi:hypothetical protein
LYELNARFDEDARFDEENIEFLQCVSCLSPLSLFVAFDVKKLLRMVELYAHDFVDVPEVVVRHQLQIHVRDVRTDKFYKVKRISRSLYKICGNK